MQLCRMQQLGSKYNRLTFLQNGYIEGNTQDVLHIMDEKYVVFQPMLVKLIFFVRSRAHLPYTPASYRIVSEEIVAMFGVTLAQVPHVIALKERYVVRIVILDKGAHKAFKALIDGKEKAHQNLVPLFSNWPWLYFDRLPFVPISFARATRDMITLLDNL